MNKKYNYAVFFDLDKTLIPYDSSTKLIGIAYREGLIGIKHFIKALALLVQYKLHLTDTKKIIATIADWVNGVSENKVKQMASELFETKFKSSIYPKAIEQIKFHRENNAEIILLSASMSLFCELFVAELQLDGALCTIMESEDGRLTGRTVGDFCFGNEKLVRLNDYCLQKNYDTQSSYFYSDSISDLPALEGVGNPICINPDKKLKKLAKNKKLTIYNW
jgi:HAD superfamily hydrolase (TIGR01490 family)